MLTLTSSTILMIIAIALIIGWAIGRRVKHQGKKNTRSPIGPGGPKESHILSQLERDQVAGTREPTPKEQMKRKLPPSRRTVGR